MSMDQRLIKTLPLRMVQNKNKISATATLKLTAKCLFLQASETDEMVISYPFAVLYRIWSAYPHVIPQNNDLWFFSL